MATAHWASYMRQRAHAVRRLALRRSTTQSPPSKLSQASALLDPRIRGRSPLAHQQTHTLHPGHLCPLPPQSTCPCPRPGRGVCQILARCSLVAPKIAPKSLAAPRPSHYNISAGRRWPSKTPPQQVPVPCLLRVDCCDLRTTALFGVSRPSCAGLQIRGAIPASSLDLDHCQ